MRRRTLGWSDIDVGALGLGCMGMSWGMGEADDEESVRVIHRALELGITMLDTADVYGPFANERLVGRAIAGRRDDVVVATKAGLVVNDMETRAIGVDGRPEHIRQACDASLRRLGIDHIDLYYLHRPDPDVPVEESVGALGGLLDSGKVRAIGLSEADLPTLERAWEERPFAALQSELSLWTREPLDEILPWCKEHEVAFVPFAPLGRGFLTGRYRSADEFRGHIRARNPRFQPDAIEANLRLVRQVEEIADRLGATAGQVAIAWTLAQGEHVVPIPGTKRIAYLEENVAAASVELTDEDLAALDALPAPVGSRGAL
jgi:aryl-alcohol dehydrogenase-like predicted oxidoreductase